MAKQYKANYDRIEYLKGVAGIYGTSFFINEEQSKAFLNAVKHSCNDLHKPGIKEVQIDVHWGQKGKNGFVIKMRAI